MTSAKIICDSISPDGSRLITMEIELHRFVLSEFNTHRCMSRNFQSSRAVPVEKMIKQVRENPAMPVHWGKNQRGMVAEEELTGVSLGAAQGAWLVAAQEAADVASDMDSIGVHKQVVNRVLEPFVWTRGVCTATLGGYESFFKLRSDKDAQPEIKALSDAMRTALEASVPRRLDWGEYHLPYLGVKHDDGGMDKLMGTMEDLLGRGVQPTTQNMLVQANGGILNAVKISASCCAQVSYRVLDDSLDKAIKIYGMLNLPEGGEYKEDPPHFSPTEHVAMCVRYAPESDSGNFQNDEWWQYRKALEEGIEDLFINPKRS